MESVSVTEFECSELPDEGAEVTGKDGSIEVQTGYIRTFDARPFEHRQHGYDLDADIHMDVLEVEFG